MPTYSTDAASLAPFFTPRAVALIGASRDPASLSSGILRNLLHPATGFPGPVYPVNPHAVEVLGQRCYPEISTLPDSVDLAIVVLPAPAVAAAVEACGQHGVKAAVIISGGFREVGEAGAARERQAVEIARRYHMRLMGPNCIGIMDTHTPLNTTFVPSMPVPGEIAFLSQSGALCGGVIDWIVGRGIGFSRLLSMGNEADANETDLLPALVADDHTQVITLYLEDVKDGPGFLGALRDATARKSVLALKAGRTASGQTATASHTGALASAHTGFRAACRQTGVIECDTVKDMVHGAMALAYQPLLAGLRVAILTNAGGPAALAADALEPLGLALGRTSPTTRKRLRTFLLGDAQVAGPVDMLGGASERDYRQALEVVLADEATDGVLVILVPQVLVDAAAIVRAIGEVVQAHAGGKPVVACLMGEATMEGGFKAAHAYRIPAYTFPEEAVAALGVLHQRARWLARPHVRASEPAGLNGRQIRSLLVAAMSSSRTMLSAAEGRAIVQAAGITIPLDTLATSADEAAAAARDLGFPVALKLVSPDMSHKTEVGGVLLGLRDEVAVQEGYATLVQRARVANPGAAIHGVLVQQMVSGGQEVILGITRDQTFGPLVAFGLGGIYAEALADVSFRLAPLTPADAQEMLAEVRSAKLLAGLRGAPPADRDALVDALLRVSWLAQICPEISELDINPLVVLPAGKGVRALDVRVSWR